MLKRIRDEVRYMSAFIISHKVMMRKHAWDDLTTPDKAGSCRPKKKPLEIRILARQGTGIEVSEEDDEDGGVPVVRC